MKQEKKRLCLFAAFDKKGEIADYVLYYLKALAQIADVYYWGEFETSEAEKAKLEPYCKAVYCKSHGEYDFGSWRRLVQKIGRKKIETYDEVIIANDSCYGPLFDLSEVFQKMDKKDCDFWGLSSACNRHIHLQSYFLVLKKPVIQSDAFYDFMEQVKPELNYCDVCTRYEDRFTYTLSKAGFKFCSYVDFGDLANQPYKDIVAAIKNRHFPFLKVKFFLGGIRDQVGVADWRQMIQESSDYPIALIEEDLKRRGFDLAEIDQKVQQKQCDLPNPNPKRLVFRKIVKKAIKITARPLIYVMDKYTGNRTAQYLYKIDRLNRSYRQLQQKTDPDFKPKEFHISTGEEACSLGLTDIDVSYIKHFELELPLTNEADVLLIGNINLHNLVSLELYEPSVTFLNNTLGDELKITSKTTDNLCDFHFLDEDGRKMYFDFILTQPLKEHSSEAEIKQFLSNLKNQMIPESILAVLVRAEDKKLYERLLQTIGLHSATSEHGLVTRADPFQIYYDKIGSVKGYKALIYKIK